MNECSVYEVGRAGSDAAFDPATAHQRCGKLDPQAPGQSGRSTEERS